MSATGICCETCAFYAKSNPQAGNCHANPPHPFLIPGPPNRIAQPGQPNIVIQAVWPPVGVNDWCAKHQHFAAAVTGVPIDDRLAESAEGSA